MPLNWKLLIILAAIVVGTVAVAVVYGLRLLARAIRKDRREEVAYEAEMADYVDDQQTAVGRVAVPQPQWHVWYTPIALSDTDRADIAEDQRAVPLADRRPDLVIDDDTVYPGPPMPPRPPGISQYPPYVPKQRDGGDS